MKNGLRVIKGIKNFFLSHLTNFAVPICFHHTHTEMHGKFASCVVGASLFAIREFEDGHNKRTFMSNIFVRTKLSLSFASQDPFRIKNA